VAAAPARPAAVEHAPSLRERLRDDRALCLSPLGAICNDTSPPHAETTTAPHHQPPRDPNAQEEREERGHTHAPRFDWMESCNAANLPRLAAHSLSMASKAHVTNLPAAPAVVRSEEGEWAWDGEGTRSEGGDREPPLKGAGPRIARGKGAKCHAALFPPGRIRAAETRAHLAARLSLMGSHIEWQSDDPNDGHTLVS
jgi:hypothetical protein